MLRWKKGLVEKKGLRVKSSEANMFKVPILVSYKLWQNLLSHGVFLFQFNNKDKNLDSRWSFKKA